jgi:hypothetical protein
LADYIAVFILVNVRVNPLAVNALPFHSVSICAPGTGRGAARIADISDCVFSRNSLSPLPVLWRIARWRIQGQARPGHAQQGRMNPSKLGCRGHAQQGQARPGHAQQGRMNPSNKRPRQSSRMAQDKRKERKAGQSALRSCCLRDVGLFATDSVVNHIEDGFEVPEIVQLKLPTSDD